MTDITYLDYIAKNADRIGRSRQGFTIEQIYPGKTDKLRQIGDAFFQLRLDELERERLTRSFVRDSFNRNTYTGFVATMLWGGLGMTNWNQLVTAMTIDKPEVECKINSLQGLLEKDRIQEAFMSLQVTRDRRYPPTNKFAGIDISYFTKPLYFLYRGNGPLTPVIYDKWGTFIHAGILISQKETGLLNTFYNLGCQNGKFRITVKSNRETGYRYNIYADYLRRMKELSTTFCQSDPGLLEEFLFGRDLKHAANRNDDNPRFFVSNYVQDYYS